MPRAKQVRLNLKSMTKTEARIAVCEDVVAQIRRGRYQAKAGYYVEPTSDLAELIGRPSLQAVADATRAGEGACEVCAVGAGVISVAGLFNGPEFNNPWDNFYGTAWDDDESDLSFHERLRKVFSHRVVGEIETVFERDSTFAEEQGTSVERAEALEEWGYLWDEPSDRLEALYLNLLSTEGKRIDLKWQPSPRSRLGRAMADR